MKKFPVFAPGALKVDLRFEGFRGLTRTSRVQGLGLRSRVQGLGLRTL